MSVVNPGQFTSGNINQQRKIRDVSPTIAFLAPRIAQILLLAARPLPAPLQNAFGYPESGARGVRLNVRSVANFKFEWFEDQAKSNSTLINNGGGYAAGATSMVVDDASIFAPNDLVDVVSTGEIMEILTVTTGTNTITVTRSWGTTAAAAIADNATLLIIGNAFSEAATKVIQPQRTMTNTFNYVQDTRHAFASTYVLDHHDLYGGNQRMYLRKKFLMDHQKYMEASLLYGEKADGTGSDGSPKKTTGGLLEFLTSNNLAAGGILTKATWNKWLRDLFSNGSPEKIIFCSNIAAGAINQFAADNSSPPISQIFLANNARSFGLNIMSFTTKFGIVHLIMHGQLTGDTYSGYAIAVDPDQLTLARVRGGFFMNLRENIVLDGSHVWTDEYTSYFGLMLTNPEYGGVLTGITG